MIIALTGNNNVGKDTCAKIIQYLIAGEKYHRKIPIDIYSFLGGENEFKNRLPLKIDSVSGWKIKKFAGSVNECYKIITGIDFHALNRVQKEEERDKFITFAEVQKNIFGENVWVDSLFSQYSPLYKQKHQEITSPELIFQGYYVLCDTCESRFYSMNKRAFMCNSCVDKQEDKFPNWIISDLRFLNEAQAIKDRGGKIILIERNPTYYKGEFPGELVDYTIFNNGTIEELVEKVKNILEKEKII